MTRDFDPKYENDDNYLEEEVLISSGESVSDDAYRGNVEPNEDDYFGSTLIENKRSPKD